MVLGLSWALVMPYLPSALLVSTFQVIQYTSMPRSLAYLSTRRQKAIFWSMVILRMTLTFFRTSGETCCGSRHEPDLYWGLIVGTQTSFSAQSA